MADAAFVEYRDGAQERAYFLRTKPTLMNYSDEQLKQRYRFGRNKIMYLSDMSRDKI